MLFIKLLLLMRQLSAARWIILAPQIIQAFSEVPSKGNTIIYATIF